MLEFNGRKIGKTLEEDNWEIIIGLDELDDEIDKEIDDMLVPEDKGLRAGPLTRARAEARRLVAEGERAYVLGQR